MSHKIDKRDVDPDYCSPKDKKFSCCAWNEKKGKCLAMSEGPFCLHMFPVVKK